MYSTLALPIIGYEQMLVPNTLFWQEHDTDHLTLILPGLTYTAQMPLLYYPTTLSLSHGSDVLWVQYAYDQQPDYQKASDAEKERWLFEDVFAAYQSIIAQRAYRRLTLIGKSLGTNAMLHLLLSANLPEEIDCIWLTPMLRREHYRRQFQQLEGHAARSLFVIGTADRGYHPDHVAEVEAVTSGQSVLVDGANHDLEIEEHLMQSLHALMQIMHAVQLFLTGENGTAY